MSYSSIYDIPFLNDVTTHDNSIKDIIDYHVNSLQIYSDITDMENKISVYESDRNTDVDISLDKDISFVYQQNRLLNEEVKENHDQFMKYFSNRLDQYTNQSHYLSFLDEVIEGDNTSKGKGEHDIIKDKIETVNEENEILKRKQNIYDYYEKKRLYQISIFKNLCYILLVILIISICYKLGLIHDNIFIGSIGIGLACIVIYLGYVSMDMIYRDHNIFDEYTSMNTHHYLNENKLKEIDIPLHAQKDTTSKECQDIISVS